MASEFMLIVNMLGVKAKYVLMLSVIMINLCNVSVFMLNVAMLGCLC